MKKKLLLKYRKSLFTILSNLLFILVLTTIGYTNAQSGILFYGASDSTDELITFNDDTGITNVIGSFNLNGDIESLKYNPDFPTLYTVDGNVLGTVDVTTGNFTPLPNSIGNNLNGSLGSKNITDVDGMAFDPQTNELFFSVRYGGIGKFPLKTTIKYFSGGETNTNNNDDIDYIEYKNN